eukprot:5894095-Alexandrium_andersonii.AAC.1
MFLSVRPLFAPKRPRSAPQGIALCTEKALNCPFPEGPCGAERGLSVQNGPLRCKKRPSGRKAVLFCT